MGSQRGGDSGYSQRINRFPASSGVPVADDVYRKRPFEACCLAPGEVGYYWAPQLNHTSQMAHRVNSIKIHVLVDKGDPTDCSWSGFL